MLSRLSFSRLIPVYFSHRRKRFAPASTETALEEQATEYRNVSNPGFEVKQTDKFLESHAVNVARSLLFLFEIELH